jgi:S1-C subfamily serine protease
MLIRSNTLQVQRRGDGTKYHATVAAICNECDLALLRVEDDDFWNSHSDNQNGNNIPKLQPLEFGPLPALQDEVEVLGYPTGGDSSSVTQGLVSRIEMQEYTQASSNLLAIQIDAAISKFVSLFVRGLSTKEEDVLDLLYIAHTPTTRPRQFWRSSRQPRYASDWSRFSRIGRSENIGYVIPVTVVQHVLEDLERNGGKYTGFCSMGVSLSFLENVAFQKSLGMVKERYSGVMVEEISPTAACRHILRVNDVILSMDGIPVANDGKIPFRPGERVSLACYVQTKFAGDMVQVQVLRKGRELSLQVPVGIYGRLVRPHWNNQPPPYIVVAGMVFTSLSVPYLCASEAFESYVSESISYLLGKWREPLKRETDEVVVLAQVLAHRENLGYDELTDLHLLKVNEKKVRSLHHLKRLLDCNQEPFLRFEFAPDNLIVLESSSLEQVTQELQSGASDTRTLRGTFNPTILFPSPRPSYGWPRRRSKNKWHGLSGGGLSLERVLLEEDCP